MSQLSDIEHPIIPQIHNTNKNNLSLLIAISISLLIVCILIIVLFISKKNGIALSNSKNLTTPRVYSTPSAIPTISDFSTWQKHLSPESLLSFYVPSYGQTTTESSTFIRVGLHYSEVILTTKNKNENNGTVVIRRTLQVGNTPVSFSFYKNLNTNAYGEVNINGVKWYISITYGIGYDDRALPEVTQFLSSIAPLNKADVTTENNLKIYSNTDFAFKYPINFQLEVDPGYMIISEIKNPSNYIYIRDTGPKDASNTIDSIVAGKKGEFIDGVTTTKLDKGVKITGRTACYGNCADPTMTIYVLAVHKPIVGISLEPNKTVEKVAEIIVDSFENVP